MGYKAGAAGAAQAAAEVVRADPGTAPALLAVRTGTGNDDRTTGRLGSRTSRQYRRGEGRRQLTTGSDRAEEAEEATEQRRQEWSRVGYELERGHDGKEKRRRRSWCSVEWSGVEWNKVKWIGVE